MLIIKKYRKNCVFATVLSGRVYQKWQEFMLECKSKQHSCSQLSVKSSHWDPLSIWHLASTWSAFLSHFCGYKINKGWLISSWPGAEGDELCSSLDIHMQKQFRAEGYTEEMSHKQTPCEFFSLSASQYFSIVWMWVCHLYIQGVIEKAVSWAKRCWVVQISLHAPIVQLFKWLYRKSKVNFCVISLLSHSHLQISSIWQNRHRPSCNHLFALFQGLTEGSKEGHEGNTILTTWWFAFCVKKTSCPISIPQNINIFFVWIISLNNCKTQHWL